MKVSQAVMELAHLWRTEGDIDLVDAVGNDIEARGVKTTWIPIPGNENTTNPARKVVMLRGESRSS